MSERESHAADRRRWRHGAERAADERLREEGEPMTVRPIAAASTKRAAIGAIYAAVDAPDWAAPNLDGLADVLRDLSWLPPGAVTLAWRPSPQLPVADRRAIQDVLRAAIRESAGSDYPLTVRGID